MHFKRGRRGKQGGREREYMLDILFPSEDFPVDLFEMFKEEYLL